MDLTGFIHPDEVNRLQLSLSISDETMKGSLSEMEGLVGKVCECQNKTQLMLTEIPEKLFITVMDHIGSHSTDKDCQVGVEDLYCLHDL